MHCYFSDTKNTYPLVSEMSSLALCTLANKSPNMISFNTAIYFSILKFYTDDIKLSGIFSFSSYFVE